MRQMYKVFINDKPVIFTSDSNNLHSPLPALVLEISKQSELDEAVSQFELSKEYQSLVLISRQKPEKLFRKFTQLYEEMDAAGGLVENSVGEWLFIYRFGKWDLPKGKLEKRETPEQAALREVEEETGLHNIALISQLPLTYHTYYHKTRKILKRTFWYKMQYPGNEIPVPQLSEDITDAQWFHREALDTVYQNTYASIYDLVHSETNMNTTE